MKIEKLNQLETISSRERVLEAAEKLKQGEGVRVTEMAKLFKMDDNTVRRAARSKNAIAEYYVGGIKIQFVINPKFTK